MYSWELIVVILDRCLNIWGKYEQFAIDHLKSEMLSLLYTESYSKPLHVQ